MKKFRHGWLTLLACALACVAAPQAALADVASDYTGQAKVESDSSTYVGYSWTGSAWLRADRAARVPVYVAPFTGEWSWTWTSSTGWVAMLSADLVAATSADAKPRLTAVSAASTTTSRWVRVNLTATDDVAVTRMRVARESGTWGAWQSYHASFNFLLSAGNGAKRIYVQVADADGNTSDVLYRRVTYTAS